MVSWDENSSLFCTVGMHCCPKESLAYRRHLVIERMNEWERYKSGFFRMCFIEPWYYEEIFGRVHGQISWETGASDRVLQQRNHFTSV